MLGYLLDPFIQIQNDNGTPIVGAKIYVYNADTTNLAITYNDFEGHLNTNPVITDDLGNATIIADDGIEYDISVYDENDLLLFTKKYISIDKTSSAGGNIQVAPGYGVSVERIGNTFVVSVDTDLIATKDDLDDKQDKLQGGANIEITNDNTINVVQRKELVTQYPLRTNRTNNRIKIYLDSDFSDEFKTKQTPVEYGGASGQYISYITQNTNGDIEATVSETVFPSFDNIHAGDNIDITRNGNDLTISGKDWNNEINSATSGKLDKTPSAVGNSNNPIYIDSNSDFQPCFSNTQTFMGWNNTFDSTLANHDNAMYGNGNNYNLTYTGNYQPSAYDNIILGTNNSAVLSHDSYLYNTCNIGSKNKIDLYAAADIQIVGSRNTTSATNGGYLNECGIFGDKNTLAVTQYPGDEYKSQYDNYIFGCNNSISGIGWGCTIFGYENTTNARSLSFMFGYKNKINDNQSYESILFGDENNINATTAENKRLTNTCLVGFDNTINASNRTIDYSKLYAFGEGNTISSGYQTLLYGYGNTAGNVSAALCFGKGLGAESNKMKYGTTNCYLEIDEIAGKIYKVINGTRTEI